MNKKGFTILELLVVMIIIGILAAILFPALRGVRESGRRIQCVNNLRQHGIAWYLYLDDHNERFPIPGVRPIYGGIGDIVTHGGKKGTNYISYGEDYGAQYRALNRYLDISSDTSPAVEVFHCPDDIKPNGSMERTSFDQYGCSYFFSSYISIFGAVGNNMSRPFRTITSPKNKVCMEACFEQNIPGHSGRGKDPGDQLTPVIVLFADGHVGGPYKYTDDFENYNVNTTKPILFDPNGTADIYD